MLKKNVISLAALGGFVFLAFGSNCIAGMGDAYSKADTHEDVPTSAVVVDVKR